MFVESFERKGTRGQIASLAEKVDRKEAEEFELVLRRVPEQREKWVLNFEFVVSIHYSADFFEVLKDVVSELEEDRIDIRVITSPNALYDGILTAMFPGRCFRNDEDAILSFMPAA